MKDYLFKEYELNEKYHDSKENRAWIACALYFTYSLVVIKWILEINNKVFIKENYLLLMFTILIIDTLSFLFILFQFHKKALSVKKAAKVKTAIANQYNETDKNIWVNRVWQCELSSDANWLRRYKIEIPLLLLVIVFPTVKIIIAFNISGILINTLIITIIFCIFLFVIGFLIGFTINKKTKRNNGENGT